MEEQPGQDHYELDVLEVLENLDLGALESLVASDLDRDRHSALCEATRPAVLVTD